MAKETNEELVSKIYQTALDSSLLASLFELLIDGVPAASSEENRLLVSHLNQAVEIFSEIQRQSLGHDLLKAALNQLPIGVLVLDDEQDIVEANDCAVSLIRHSRYLRISNNKLHLCDSDINQSFQNLLNSNTSDHEQLDDGQLSHFVVGREIELDQKVSIFVLPADAINSDKKNNSGNMLVFITIGKSDFKLNNRKLKKIFQLTDAECLLLNSVVNSANKLPEVAEELNLSYHTVRSYMKTLLTKTNTNSQAELIKLILTIPALHMPLVGQAKDASHEYRASARQHSFRLENGRELCISQYGVLDGYPVFYFHGLVGGRLECDHPVDALIVKNIRLIAIDRPGFGGSTKDPSKSFQSWCADLDNFCQHEHIAEFSIITYSSGSVWGLFAAQYFGTRVQQLCLVSNIGLNPFTNINGNGRYTDELILKFTEHSPAVSRAMLKLVCKFLYSDIDRYFSYARSRALKPDQVALNEYSGHIARAFIGRGKHAWKEMANELHLLSGDWPNDLNILRCPVTIWHGKQDQHKSIIAMERVLPKLAGAALNYVDNQGHFIFHRMWPDIVSSISVPSRYRISTPARKPLL